MTVATSATLTPDTTFSPAVRAVVQATQLTTTLNINQADFSPALRAVVQAVRPVSAPAVNDFSPAMQAVIQAIRFTSVAGLDADFSSGVGARGAYQRSFDSIGVAGGGGGIVTYYKKRARDSACVSPTYVTWVTTNVNQAYPNPLPCGGPLVETIIAEFWQVQVS